MVCLTVAHVNSRGQEIHTEFREYGGAEEHSFEEFRISQWPPIYHHGQRPRLIRHQHGRMGRGGHGLLNVSPVPNPSMSCGRATPETASRPSSSPLDTRRRTPMGIKGVWHGVSMDSHDSRHLLGATPKAALNGCFRGSRPAGWTARGHLVTPLDTPCHTPLSDTMNCASTYGTSGGGGGWWFGDCYRVCLNCLGRHPGESRDQGDKVENYYY
jgi:hypothetical protein